MATSSVQSALLETEALKVSLRNTGERSFHKRELRAPVTLIFAAIIATTAVAFLVASCVFYLKSPGSRPFRNLAGHVRFTSRLGKAQTYDQ